MNNDHVIYFSPKFWPDRQSRKCPNDSKLLVDEPNPFDVLEYRQAVRLWYRNWVPVWRTYSYYTNFGVLVVPLAGLLTWNIFVFLALALAWVAAKRYIGKKLWDFMCIKYLITGLMDKELIPVFGNLQAFDEE